MIKYLLMRFWMKVGKRADKYRAILAAACLMVLLSGCSVTESWMRSYVAVHDAADSVLAEKTNLPPVIVTPHAVTPAKCQCDLSAPVVEPERGIECPTPNGMDIRFLGWSPSAGDWVFIPRPDGVTIAGNQITGTCSPPYHYLGYKVPSSGGPLVKEATGTYGETYRLYYEKR